MQNEVYPAIAEVVEFIERNIKIPINLDDIVAHVNISKYHLHRLFKALTGYSLIAYVRGRKLSLSLSELLQTNYSIIEIAYEYGFEYEQSYIRAFKAHYHITPNHVRKSQPTLEIVQKLDMKSMLSVARGLIYKPMFMVKPQFYLAGIECDINHADNFKNSTANKQALKFQRYIKHIDFAVNPNVYYGYVRYSDCPEIHNFYMPSIEVSQSNTTNPNLSVQTIPTSEYAVFKYIGFHSPYALTFVELNEIYESIDAQIFTNDVYQQSMRFHFERMDMKICSETYCEADIYIPIINRAIQNQ